MTVGEIVLMELLLITVDSGMLTRTYDFPVRVLATRRSKIE